MLIHHTNLADAEPDERRLVCYDCGVACDLTKMREDRLVALRSLGAERPVGHAAARVDSRGFAPGDDMIDVSERGGGSPGEVRERTNQRETERAERVRLAGHIGADQPYSTYRIRFAKLGRAAFLGHLDLLRLLARSFRRADLSLALTRGFSPKPRIVFGPALGLGIPSLGELVDVDLEHVPLGKRSWEASPGDERIELSADEIFARLAAVCPPGIELRECSIVRLGGHPSLANGTRTGDPGLGKLIDAIDLVIRPAPDGIAFDAARLERIAAAFVAKPSAIIMRASGGKRSKQIDVRAFVTAVDVIDGEAATKLAAALDWADGPLLRARVSTTTDGSAKPAEVARALGVYGSEELRGDHALIARLGVVTQQTGSSQHAAART
jgi:hypothetical protein